MPRKKLKFGDGDIVECPGDGEYGCVERYLIYGYLPDTTEYVVLKATDATECGAGIEDCDVEPEEVSVKYLEQFGKKIGSIDLSIFFDGTD